MILDARANAAGLPSFDRLLAGACRSLGVAALVAFVMPAPAAERTALQPMDLFAIQAASDPQMSPDGKRIAYVRIRADVVQDEWSTSLWVTDADGRNQQPLTDPKESATDPRWSPDGRLLAFTMLEPSTPKSLGNPVAAPPGSTWKAGPLVIDRARYRADGMGYLPSGHAHLFVVPSDGGATRKLTKEDSGELPLIGRPFDWTPDSRALVASLVHWDEAHILKGRMFDTSLFLIPIDGEPKKLIDRDGPQNWPSVSPDGRYIAYTGYDTDHDTAKRSYTVAKLFLLDRRTGERRLLAGTLDRDIFAPRWASNGKGIYAVFSDHGLNELALFDLVGTYHVVSDTLGFANTAYMAEPGFTMARDGTVAMPYATTTSTGEIAVARPGTAPTRVTRLNDALFDARTLGRLEEFNYHSTKDNLPIQGWILYPPNFDSARHYPLILEIHGGPDAGYGLRFDPEKQLMAAAGYVVVYVNPRGSTGYGADFGNLIQDDFPNHEFEDLMSGVDAVLARGFIAPERLYVTGGSGGGTLTAWLISHMDRFRAAAVLYPVIDWQSEALTSDILPLVFDGFFHGTPWTQPAEYRRRSLLSSVDQVHTPVLVMTGEVDYRTPISESEQYFAALRYHAVESVFVRMPLENHGIRAFPSHFAEKVPMITGWFDSHQEGSNAPPTH